LKALAGLSFVLAAGAAPGLSWPTDAATTEYVVVDRNSGLAINGFDPIAYFTDHAAVLGRGEFEYRYAGAVWRFHNLGNRAAFAADPDVYMPRYGGYDAVAVGRQAPVAGDPRVWVITGERLYLFSSAESRAAFISGTAAAIATADRAWPKVQLTLSP
jgi:hypothetical protein